MDKIVDYVERLRAAGTDNNYYTTAAAVTCYLAATDNSYMLRENHGWINIYS